MSMAARQQNLIIIKLEELACVGLCETCQQSFLASGDMRHHPGQMTAELACK